MSQSFKPKKFTTLHAMSFLYLTFAKSTDNELSKDEIDAIFSQLKRWDSTNHYNTNEIIKETWAWFRTIDNWDEMFDECAKITNGLYDVCPDDMKKLILEDLILIAKSDGIVKEGEIKFFNTISKTWGIEITLE